MKNIFKLLSVLLMLSSINVFALNIDTSENSSISLKHTYGDKVFSNTNAYIYKIASLDEYGTITYTDNFADLDIDLKNLTTQELNALSVTLDSKVKQGEIPADLESKTNEAGIAQFNSLNPGVYLIKIDTVEDKDYRYKVLPMLISLPLYDEINNQYRYDVAAVSKTEAEYIGSQTGDGNTTNPPNTVDKIIIYAAVFIISLIVIIGLVCYINEKNKRNEVKKDDEKNN